MRGRRTQRVGSSGVPREASHGGAGREGHCSTRCGGTPQPKAGAARAVERPGAGVGMADGTAARIGPWSGGLTG